MRTGPIYSMVRVWLTRLMTNVYLNIYVRYTTHSNSVCRKMNDPFNFFIGGLKVVWGK